jgi:hypothetical protein
MTHLLEKTLREVAKLAPSEQDAVATLCWKNSPRSRDGRNSSSDPGSRSRSWQKKR